MAQVGRISGPLLTANLERNGIDLAFRNTLDDTQLLYLDVNSGLLGVNKSNPGNQLDVAGHTKTSNLNSTNSASIADFTLETGNINNLTGDINLNASDTIKLSNFQTDNIGISDNTISTYRSNATLDLIANGTGTVEVLSSMNVDGNIHATGNITFDGTVTFGDTVSQDTVTFNADFDSDILPDQTQTYNLGSNLLRWDNLFTLLVNGGTILAADLDISGIQPFSRRQGNIIYVAQNGDDTNVGDHPNGPFKTLKRALAFADASTQGPVQIFVYAGGYEEETPLTVPSNVSIIGEDMRNTIIRPESAYQSNDVFLLNGESTIQNLTIKDFYYDSVGDTGYAFRFAPNTVVSTRSPYIQNVTVITQGTTTSASDLRGFASGDAGKGALVDGADVLSASQEASMLFHSCTFITPGVDAVTMTNGVRVEWLNSFTYFANRGLYAINGATGHLSTDGSTVKYGAEIRSIGSANVYGNYGAVADGADCIMYLIQHNFAYIGVGKFVDNDPSRVIQSQEVTELNSGRVYYQSIDHLGNFRVGNNFFVDQERGETNLVLTEAQIDSLNGMTVTTGGSTTIIDGTRVETGNIRLRDNTVSSLAGNITVSAADNNINLQSSTNIFKNLSITGNLSFDGSLINLGNEVTDTIAFNTEFTQDVIPDISGLYKLGSASKTWKKAWLSQAQISDIKFQDNTITTTVSNADLELKASGTGKINIESNNVNVTNNFTVDLTTDIDDLNINGTLTHTGNKSQTGDYTVTNLTITNVLDISSQVQLEEILFDGNVIQTTTSNADLELRASGTGNIIVPNNDVVFSNNLNVRDITGDNLTVQENVTSVQLVASNDITIRDNFITTTQLNSDLEFIASGTGLISTVSPVQINTDMSVLGNLTFSGDLSSDDVLGALNINAAKILYAEELHTDNQIHIWDNNIATVVSNSDLELRANSAGGVSLKGIMFEGNILSTGTEDSSSVDLNLTSTGNGNFNTIATGAIKLPAGDNLQRINTLGDLRFNNVTNLFEGYATSHIAFGGVFSDDRLTSLTVDPVANNINMIVSGDNDPIDSSKLVGQITGRGMTLNAVEVEDIFINNNTITTTVSNSNLDLKSLGTGEVTIDNISFIGSTIKNNTPSSGILSIANTRFGKVKFDNTYGIVVPYGTDGERPADPPVGDTRWNTTSQILETWDGDTYITAAGIAAAISAAEFDDILLEYTLALG
jgi:hypothetical protein